MKILRIVTLSLLVCLPLLAQDPRVAKQIETDIRTLAADSMEGRGLGTKGIELSADYLEKRLRAIGLQPAFKEGYRQPFPVKMGVSSGAGNRLDGVAAADWTPLGFSSAGRFSAPLVFAGYGIDAPPLGYREFEGIDLKGKVALILRYEPQEKDDASPFDGRRPSRWSAMRYKVLQARERGAVAVIFTTGPLQDEGKDKVPPLANDGPESPAGIPVLQVKTSVAQKWLAGAGIDLTRWQNDVDHDLAPRSRLLPMQATGMVDVKPEFANTSNVMGMLPGRGKLASGVVVLGAHYDHLGYGGEGSLRPNVHEIHNGADDNASGTAGVLAAAEILSAELKDVADRRTVIFALFSGEERGLAGSGYFVGHAPVAMEKVVAMVNMDMVGALRKDQVTAFGTDSAAEWKALVDRAGAGSGLEITASGDGYGPSDQTSFYAVHIPVLHFFTGAHDRYHTPDDDADAVNFAGEARVIGVVAKVVSELARGTVTPQYARASAAPAMQGDSRGYGAYLGTVPDYSAMDATTGGVLLSDVRAGGPAERAGIKGGDRILEIGGTRIENLYDMTYALQDHKPGETVDVFVERKGERVKLRATLGSRGAMSAPAPAASPAPAAAPTAPSTPAPSAQPAPHATEPAPAAVASTFYDGRPGKGFVIGAGKPFAQTFEGEKHLADIRQLTFGGENAEAYFGPDGKHLIYQSTPPGAACDQQYILDLATGESKRVSSGKGRTTCGYFDYPEADRIVYASTEAGGAECPPPPDRSHGYVWAVYPSFDIYEANLDGSNARRLTTTPGYDAEMTWCHRGGKAVFTSMRDGDLDLYEMDEAGNVRRLTNSPGYDGGAFYSADCREIVWRANHPTGAALDEYKALLAKGLVRPTEMEIFVMNADGTNQRQLTTNRAANFCPYFFPDGNRIIYASNVGDPKGREFELWAQDKRGGEAQRITAAPGFDGFPMFSPDGTLLVWASNRADVASHSTNLFIARWVE
jgi:Tol biopolymer transport system component